MISQLHYITQGDTDALSHALAAEEACALGINWVQLRMKGLSDKECMETALRCRKVCDWHAASLIINDRVALAKAVGADGVHLGREDMDPMEAREILGTDAIIGGTANTFEDIEELAAKAVDYIGIGPYRFTPTKEKLSPVIGLEGYWEIVRQCQSSGIFIPLIAIGGIRLADISPLMASGVHGVAVASLINTAKDKAAVVGRIMDELRKPATLN